LTHGAHCPSELLVPDILSRPAEILLDAQGDLGERGRDLHLEQLRREKFQLAYYGGNIPEFQKAIRAQSEHRLAHSPSRQEVAQQIVDVQMTARHGRKKVKAKKLVEQPNSTAWPAEKAQLAGRVGKNDWSWQGDELLVTHHGLQSKISLTIKDPTTFTCCTSGILAHLPESNLEEVFR
jgi:hypothetical protein